MGSRHIYYEGSTFGDYSVKEYVATGEYRCVCRTCSDERLVKSFHIIKKINNPSSKAGTCNKCRIERLMPTFSKIISMRQAGMKQSQISNALGIDVYTLNQHNATIKRLGIGYSSRDMKSGVTRSTVSTLDVEGIDYEMSFIEIADHLGIRIIDVKEALESGLEKMRTTQLMEYTE